MTTPVSQSEDAVRDDGLMAFPQSLSVEGPFGGMSLRDYFAGQALAGVLANPVTPEDARRIEKNGDPSGREFQKLLAEQVYAVADALLAARKS